MSSFKINFIKQGMESYLPSYLHIEAGIENALASNAAIVFNSVAVASNYHKIKQLKRHESHQSLMVSATQEIFNFLEESSYDIVLTLNGHLLEKYMPGFFYQLKKRAKFIIAWQIDDPYYIDEGLSFLKNVDIIPTVDSSTLRIYKSIGKSSFFLPLAFDAQSKEKYIADTKSEKFDVSFVGAPFKGSRRVQLIDAMKGILLQHRTLISGASSADKWKDTLIHHSELAGCIQDRFISHSEAVKIFRSTKINLNIHKDSFGHVWDRNKGRLVARSPNERTFVLAGLGSFQLIDGTRPDTSLFFQPNQEIVTFDGIADLRRKISYYLNNDDARNAIAAASAARVALEHTYCHRVKRLVDILKDNYRKDTVPMISRTNSKPNCVIRIPAKDSFTTSGERLMGRQSANEGFLNAWFRHSGHTDFWCLARYREEAQIFASAGDKIFSSYPTKPIYRWIAQSHIHRAKDIGTIFTPGPQLADLAWMRRRNTPSSITDFSIVGMTHTTCELGVQDSLADMLTAPVYPWDAQICPSRSVQTMVTRLLNDEAAWLREHVGATRVDRPQLPLLPLGVDVTAFDPPAIIKSQLRIEWRTKWGLGKGDVCLLYVGRFDLRTKANLFPMLDALELVAQRLQADGGPKLHLVLAGWFASDWDESTLRAAVHMACPSIKVIFEDGRLPEVRRGVWHAAEVFVSLVDNIQETFGLTPLEAMASGLPVVVSDYDGYRESVRDGIDGYRIRTWQPPVGAATDLIDRHADLMLSYVEYVNRASALIGVDVGQAAEAIEQLARDPELRQRMGRAGRSRILAEYDWAKLTPRYMALFDELSLIRHATSSSHVGSTRSSWTETSVNPGLRHPRRSDPFHSFGHYASATLGADTLISSGPLLPGNTGDRRRALTAHMDRPVYAGTRPTLDAERLHQLLEVVAARTEGVRWEQWAGESSTSIELLRQLGWLAKTGLVKLSH